MTYAISAAAGGSDRGRCCGRGGSSTKPAVRSLVTKLTAYFINCKPSLLTVLPLCDCLCCRWRWWPRQGQRAWWPTREGRQGQGARRQGQGREAKDTGGLHNASKLSSSSSSSTSSSRCSGIQCREMLGCVRSHCGCPCAIVVSLLLLKSSLQRSCCSNKTFTWL
jgi:hypothetical protein